MAAQVFLVASTGEDAHVVALDTLTGTTVGSYKSGPALPRCLAEVGLGRALAVASGTRRCQVTSFWRDKEGAAGRSVVPEQASCLGASADGAWLAMGAASGKVYLWSAASGELCRVWNAHYRGVTGVAFTDRGHTLYTCAEDGSVRGWLVAGLAAGSGAAAAGGADAAARPAPLCSWTDHSLPVAALAVGAGEPAPLVVSVGADGALVGRRATRDEAGAASRTGLGASFGRAAASPAAPSRPLFRVPLPCPLRSVALDLAGRTAYAGGDDGVVYAVDVLGRAAREAADRGALGAALLGAGAKAPGGEGASPVRALRGHAAPVTALALAGPDCETLASGCEAGLVRIWDAVEGAQRAALGEGVAKGSVAGILAAGAVMGSGARLDAGAAAAGQVVSASASPAATRQLAAAVSLLPNAAVSASLGGPGSAAATPAGLRHPGWAAAARASGGGPGAAPVALLARNPGKGALLRSWETTKVVVRGSEGLFARADGRADARGPWGVGDPYAAYEDDADRLETGRQLRASPAADRSGEAPAPSAPAGAAAPSGGRSEPKDDDERWVLGEEASEGEAESDQGAAPSDEEGASKRARVTEGDAEQVAALREENAKLKEQLEKAMEIAEKMAAQNAALKKKKAVKK